MRKGDGYWAGVMAWFTGSFLYTWYPHLSRQSVASQSSLTGYKRYLHALLNYHANYYALPHLVHISSAWYHVAVWLASYPGHSWT